MNLRYTAVIFTSMRTPSFEDEYAEVARRMEEMARAQPGFLGVESVRGTDRVGITVSYWSSVDDARTWKNVAEHRYAQELGRDKFYAWYKLRIAQIVDEREFGQAGA